MCGGSADFFTETHIFKYNYLQDTFLDQDVSLKYIIIISYKIVLSKYRGLFISADKSIITKYKIVCKINYFIIQKAYNIWDFPN